MCHPGRPGPHGLGQLADSGSSGFVPFHIAKSRGSRLPRGSASAAASMFSGFCRVSSPYVGQLAVSKYTSPAAAYACPPSISRWMMSRISAMYAVARGSYVGGRMPRAL